jgi:hypothetical protein
MGPPDATLGNVETADALRALCQERCILRGIGHVRKGGMVGGFPRAGAGEITEERLGS